MPTKVRKKTALPSTSVSRDLMRPLHLPAPYLPSDAGFGVSAGQSDLSRFDAKNDDFEAAEAARDANVALKEVLEMGHREFWSQVVFDSSVKTFIDSFLMFSRREFDEGGQRKSSESGDALGLDAERDKLSRRVFMVLLRLSSPRESAQECLTRSDHASLLYDNWLFDIPKLFDVCVLYSHAAPELTRQLVKGVFDAQPKYWSDLMQALKVIRELLQKISTSFNRRHYESDPSRVAGDMALARDICINLFFFIQVMPDASTRYQSAGLLSSLTFLCDIFLPAALARFPAIQAHATVVLRAALATVTVVLRDAARAEVERFCEGISAIGNASTDAEIPSHLRHDATPGEFLRKLDKDGEITQLVKEVSSQLDSARVGYLRAVMGAGAKTKVSGTASVSNEKSFAGPPTQTSSTTSRAHLDLCEMFPDDVGAPFAARLLDLCGGDYARAVSALLDGVDLPAELRGVADRLKWRPAAVAAGGLSAVSTGDKQEKKKNDMQKAGRRRGVGRRGEQVDTMDQQPKARVPKGDQHGPELVEMKRNLKDDVLTTKSDQKEELKKKMAWVYDPYDDEFDDSVCGEFQPKLVGDATFDEQLEGDKRDNNMGKRRAKDQQSTTSADTPDDQNTGPTSLNPEIHRPAQPGPTTSRGRGRGGSRAFRDRHKARFGNHNRKKRAFGKFARSAGV
eukprot:947622_1